VKVGLLAALGSACWLTKVATTPITLARVVPQVEIFALLGYGISTCANLCACAKLRGLLLAGAGVAPALAGNLED
jgi:hypothetical protein